MSKRFSLVDNITGQIIEESDNRYPELMTDEGYRIPSHKAGVKIFDDIQFPLEMSPAEIGRMTILSKLMIGKTNMLGYRKNDNIYAYTYSEIIELAKLKQRQGVSFMRKMCKFHVMQKVTTTSGPQYYINPSYFMAAGHRLSLDLFLIFRDDLQDIIPLWVKKEFLSQAKDKKLPEATILNEAERILERE
jgi:hypothetical protein